MVVHFIGLKNTEKSWCSGFRWTNQVDKTGEKGLTADPTMRDEDDPRLPRIWKRLRSLAAGCFDKTGFPWLLAGSFRRIGKSSFNFFYWNVPRAVFPSRQRKPGNLFPETRPFSSCPGKKGYFVSPSREGKRGILPFSSRYKPLYIFSFFLCRGHAYAPLHMGKMMPPALPSLPDCFSRVV